MKKVSFKKLASIFLGFMACVIMTLPVVAAQSAPSVELMYLEFERNSAGGCSPSFYFRNNSGKEIKYLDLTFALFNRVGDLDFDTITGEPTFSLRIVGPIPADDYGNLAYDPDSTMSADEPFTRKYKFTGYSIVYNGDVKPVCVDEFGNYFFNTGSLIDYDTCVFLTEEEVNSRLFYRIVNAGVQWYSRTTYDVKLQNIIVTYMDGTAESIDGALAEAKRYNTGLTNKPFVEQLSDYSAVYNYQDYRKLNQDLVSLYGDNQYKYFQHFVSSGMKEGRQGSTEFNLAAYKANNPDLVAAFGDDNVKYYEHYISSGKAEGRKAV